MLSILELYLEKIASYCNDVGFDGTCSRQNVS
jgi:hypothetical protein